MKRLALLITSLALISAPAAASAATSGGVVLASSAKHHRLAVVNRQRVVHGYSYHGSFGDLGLGSRVHFDATGSRITKLSTSGSRAHHVSFLGRVLRSSSAGLTLRLGDGQTVTVSSHRVSAVRSMAVQAGRTPLAVTALSSGGFSPGIFVLVTETVDHGATAVSTRAAAPSSPGVSGEHQVSGVVTSVGSRSITVSTSQGTLALQIAAAGLARAGAQTCSKVTVRYHQHGAELFVDKIKTSGSSQSGSCAGHASGTSGSGSSAGAGDDGSGDGSGDDDSDGTDVIGSITAISSSGLTVNVPGQGSMSFTVDDPDITDGYVTGDQVDVTYSQDSDGTLDASDVEYDENDDLGTVDSVSSSSLTITNSDTGAQETFTADSSEGMFDGINQGDSVDVSYHLNDGNPVVDEVDETGGN